MLMYTFLNIFFTVANVLAIVFMMAGEVFAIIAKARNGAATAIGLPTFKVMMNHTKTCYWAGFAFLVINWLLCSSFALATDGATSLFSTQALIFAIAWSVMIFVTAIIDIVLKIIKPKTGEPLKISVATGIRSAIFFAIIYYIIALLIA